MKTKIYLTAAAVATLALGSCSQDQVVEQSFDAQPKAIEFGVYSGKAATETRGEEMDLAKLRVDNFGVTAFYTGDALWQNWTVIAPNFMYNQKIIAEGTDKWKYTPVKYWPTEVENKISFFAYAPYATNGNEHGITLENNDQAKTSLEFKVNNDVAQQIDFVAAVAMNQQHNATGNDATREAVSFNFKHELTRLGFTVKLDESMLNGDGATTNYTADGSSAVVIKSVKLDAPGEYYASATYTWPTDATKNGTWTGRKHATSDYDFKNSLFANLAANTKVWSGEDVGPTYGNPTLVIKDKTETDLLATFGTEQEYFFLIPVQGGLEKDAATVTIEYDIVTKDANLDDGYSRTPATKTVSLPEGILQQGKAYMVNFTIYVDQIEVTAAMESWNDENKYVDIPYTPDSSK